MDDYVMVPSEPTEEMVLNGVRAFQHAYSEHDVLEDWKDCYRAMIAMAPIHTQKWVSLTEWEREAIAVECGAMSADWLVFMEAVERALREKNA